MKPTHEEKPPHIRAFMDAWLAGEVPPPPIATLLGLEFEGYSEGEGTVSLDAGERHHNAMGTLHGGVLCDLVDVATGAAVGSVLGEGETFTTVELHISFMRPVVATRLRARARVIKRGKAIIFSECEVLDPSQRLIAKTTSTTLVRSA